MGRMSNSSTNAGSAMRWLRAESLNGRILRNIGFGVVLAAACHALVAWQLYRAGSELLVHEGLTGQAEDLAEGLRFDGAGVPRLELEAHMQWGYDAFFRHLKYRVVDARGRVLLSSDADTMPLVREGEAFRRRARSFRDHARRRTDARRDGACRCARSRAVDPGRAQRSLPRARRRGDAAEDGGSLAGRGRVRAAAVRRGRVVQPAARVASRAHRVGGGDADRAAQSVGARAGRRECLRRSRRWSRR